MPLDEFQVLAPDSLVVDAVHSQTFPTMSQIVSPLVSANVRFLLPNVWPVKK